MNLELVFAGNSVRAYLFALGMTLAGFLLASLARRLCARALTGWAARTKTALDDAVLQLVHWPLFWVLGLVGAYLGSRTLVLPEWAQRSLFGLLILSTALVVALTLSRLIDVVFATTVQRFVAATESRMDDQVVPILRRSAKGALWTLAALLVLDNFGYDVMALITGLGLGGLALAMASRDTLTNVLGGLTIFIDAPFQVGDTIDVKGVRGCVEEVGLRTTRVRTGDGHLVTIPNSAAGTSIIENLSARTSTRVALTLGLARDTPGAKCREAVDVVRAVLAQVEGVQPEPSVLVAEFSAAPAVQVTYHVAPPSKAGDARHEVNLALRDALAGAQIALA